jgi:hypothetical protein
MFQEANPGFVRDIVMRLSVQVGLVRVRVRVIIIAYFLSLLAIDSNSTQLL